MRLLEQVVAVRFGQGYPITSRLLTADDDSAMYLSKTSCLSTLLAYIFLGTIPCRGETEAILRTYCVGCHGRDDPEANIQLNSISESKWKSIEVRKITEVLRNREMPPEDAKQPSDEERAFLLNAFDDLLSQAIVREKAAGPAVSIRRMNRFQYNNAVTDLFQLNCVVFTLPERMMREHGGYFQPASGKMPDTVKVGSRPLGKSQMIEPRLGGVAAFPQDLRAENGFDNRADHLSMSPLLMESFLKLGQSIVSSPDFTPKRVGIWDEFFAKPTSTDDLSTVVRTRLETFLNRAFRGNVDGATVDRYSDYTTALIDQGSPFDQAMKAAASAIIASPRFVYLYNRGPDFQLSGGDAFDLATRLSMFLWGSLPDDRLLELAKSSELFKRDVLSAEVDRMLGDRKLKRFCDSFPAQWLQLERIISSVPDPQLFPDFYFSKYRDSMHMMMEPLLLFETVLIENRPVADLIDPDFTYRSFLLSESYGEAMTAKHRPNRRNNEVTALTFDRLPIRDRRYGGIITNAAVLTMTSGTKHTKPVTRGAWLATVIFNDPPPPPPADVPPLDEKPIGNEAKLTIRQRLASHRERSDCRGCHEKIDPLGFALENFNPVGVWRDRYENGRGIDMEGALFGTDAFTSVPEFKDAILANHDRFSRGFISHLLSFALARELNASDWQTVDAIAKQADDDGYRLQALIKRIVLSEPFRGTEVLSHSFEP